MCLTLHDRCKTAKPEGCADTARSPIPGSWAVLAVTGARRLALLSMRGSGSSIWTPPSVARIISRHTVAPGGVMAAGGRPPGGEMEVSPCGHPGPASDLHRSWSRSSSSSRWGRVGHRGHPQLGRQVLRLPGHEYRGRAAHQLPEGEYVSAGPEALLVECTGSRGSHRSDGPGWPRWPRWPRAGPAGITKMFFTSALSAPNSLAANAAAPFDFACPAGRASGGGFYTPDPAFVQIYGSLPQGNNQWRVWARNTSALPRTVYVWIQCVTTDPGTVVANKKAQPSQQAIKKAGGGKNPR